jgi:predicted phosphohydrolase
MKIRYFSDLHLEFIKPNKIINFLENIKNGSNEICILAGDIGNPYQENYNIFMNFISNNFKKTFIIPGNHEYYNVSKTVEETDVFLKEYFTKYENISFLQNSFETYQEHCFIGTTLWTKITNSMHKINDVYNIPKFDYIHCNHLNKIAVDFLEDTLQNNNNCIIITHHLPSESLINVKYKTRSLIPYNQWFYCDLDNLIEKNNDKIKCWFYGHTHTSSHNIIKGVPFLCNPIGYPGENEIQDFDKHLVIE